MINANNRRPITLAPMITYHLTFDQTLVGLFCDELGVEFDQESAGDADVNTPPSLSFNAIPFDSVSKQARIAKHCAAENMTILGSVA